jgi:hypothetical protein
VVSSLGSQPIDVIKSRIMHQPLQRVGDRMTGTLYANSFDCLLKTTRQEGVLALWKGTITPTHPHTPRNVEGRGSRHLFFFFFITTKGPCQRSCGAARGWSSSGAATSNSKALLSPLERDLTPLSPPNTLLLVHSQPENNNAQLNIIQLVC